MFEYMNTICYSLQFTYSLCTQSLLCGMKRLEGKQLSAFSLLKNITFHTQFLFVVECLMYFDAVLQMCICSGQVGSLYGNQRNDFRCFNALWCEKRRFLKSKLNDILHREQTQVARESDKKSKYEKNFKCFTPQ